MLIKLLKHDLRAGLGTFATLGAVALAAGLIMAALAAVGGMVVGVLFAVPIFVAVAVATIIFIYRFFAKSMFGSTGHLTLTLPAGRAALLASKLIVSVFWFTAAMLLAFAITALFHLVSPHTAIGWWFGETAVRISGMASFFVTSFLAIFIMFFYSALTNSVIAGRRVHGIIAAAIGLVYGGAGLMLMEQMGQRHHHFVTFENTWHTAAGTTSSVIAQMYIPQMGWAYGRIFVADTPWGIPVFVDVYQVGLALVMAAFAAAATHYLLKKRIAI